MNTERNDIIRVEALTKIFNGKVKAVDAISFGVKEGEILGFLGPNGAGKTTTLNVLATLLKPTSGLAIVNGHDVTKEPDAVRHDIGYVFQDPTLDIELTGRENLDFHGRLYNLNRETRKQRISEMLKIVQLTERSDDFVKTYSGGMKRRLEIARGLLHHPRVLFLDEPTLGLDPQTRRSIWEHIQRLNQEKRITIILTTHYTEEADHLCDRILILDFGKIVALDTSERLKERLEGDVVSLIFNEPVLTSEIRGVLEKRSWIRRIDSVSSSSVQADASTLTRSLGEMSLRSGMGGITGESPHHGKTNGKSPDPHRMMSLEGMGLGKEDMSSKLNLLVDDGGRRIPLIVKLMDENGVLLESVELHKPTLDDVFLSVTGRHIRDERGSFIDMVRRHRIMRQARGRRGNA